MPRISVPKTGFRENAEKSWRDMRFSVFCVSLQKLNSLRLVTRGGGLGLSKAAPTRVFPAQKCNRGFRPRLAKPANSPSDGPNNFESEIDKTGEAKIPFSLSKFKTASDLRIFLKVRRDVSLSKLPCISFLK